MQPQTVAATIVALALAATGCTAPSDDAQATDRTYLALTGTVEEFDPGMAIGGETEPAGYVLDGASADTILAYLQQADIPPEERQRMDPQLITKAPRLYLRHKGKLDHEALAEHEGDEVTVQGSLDVIFAGGVERPLMSFPVMDVVAIDPLGGS